MNMVQLGKNISVVFEPAVEAVTIFSPVFVSVQRGLMPRIIVWACGLAMIVWLADRARWGRARHSAVVAASCHTTGVLTPGWKDPS